MKIRTRVRAGSIITNHNTTHRARARGLKVRTNVRAGSVITNHNTTRAGLAV